MDAKLTVFDIDGTLADDSLKKTFSPYQYYTDDVLKDLEVNDGIANVARRLSTSFDTHVAVVSGRQEKLRLTTEMWLRRNIGITNFYNPVRLFLRPTGSSHEQISSYKLTAVLNMVRLQSPKEITIFDDDAATLRLYHTALTSYKLSLFLVQSGIATWWKPLDI